VALCTARGEQWGPEIAADGSGGAIVTWFDRRSGIYDIYAQRLDAAGAVQWPVNGVVLCAAKGDQADPTIEHLLVIQKADYKTEKKIAKVSASPLMVKLSK
jgi:hypothetical protein